MTTPSTIPTPDQARDSWDQIADDFDQFTTPLTLRLGEQAVERVGLRRGSRFLDVGAGSGGLSIPAARRGAEVLATDIAPTMVERLRERARAEGLTDLETAVMDGCALDLEDDTFDVSGSMNGVSLFPDLERGLAEMVRVTRPGGRVLVVTFGPIQNAEFLTFFMGAMKATVPGFTGLPTDPPPPPFHVAEGDALRRRMSDAGLAEVGVEPLTWEMEFRSGSHFWDAMTSSNPIPAEIVANLTDEQADDVRELLDRMLRERSAEGAAILKNEVLVGIGTK